MNLATLLHEAAGHAPEAPALAHGTVVTAEYATHAERSSRLAGALRNELGLAPGDRVALLMKNDPAYSEIMFGIWQAGCAAVPINARLHSREVAWILENCGARICFTDSGHVEDLAAATQSLNTLDRIMAIGSSEFNDFLSANAIPVADVDENDLAWLFYTSGTTGRPKGAMLSHRNLRAMNRAYLASVDEIKPGDSIIHAAPMSHGSGLYLLPHVERGAVQIIPESGAFDLEELPLLFQHWTGITMFMAPTMVTRMVARVESHGIDTGNLKSIIYGGAPMYLEDCLKSLSILGNKLIQIYGQGESPMTITVLSRRDHENRENPDYQANLASVGCAQAGVRVRVVDKDDRDVGSGELGEVIVQGESVMNGYWNNPEASADTLRNGWLHTGDVGILNEAGYLTLKDRSKDVIISGGSNIYPREVEEVLLRDSRVLECSVIGKPDPDWGETVVAYVVTAEGSEIPAEDLDALCLEHIARFKRPKLYHFIEALPKNNYGKVLKTELRKRV